MIDLFLEYQKRKFKYFYANKSFSLKENNKLFCLHILWINKLKKIKSLINQIMINLKRDKNYFQKDAFFDILSLANQLH